MNSQLATDSLAADAGSSENGPPITTRPSGNSGDGEQGVFASSAAQRATSSGLSSADSSGDVDTRHSTEKLIYDLNNTADSSDILGISRNTSGDDLRHTDLVSWQAW